MNNNKHLALIIIQLFYFGAALCQINLTFVKYLSDNSFKREHYAYLFKCSGNSNSDSLDFLKAKYYIQYPNDSLFLEHYLKSKALFISDTGAFTLTNIHFLTSSYSAQTLWYSSCTDNDISTGNNQIRATYLAALNPTQTNMEILPENLRSAFLNYKKAYLKQPYLAGILSAAVPGLGKLYAGRKRSFYTTLFIHAVSGIESYESIRRLGIKHPFSIFSVGLFSVFYAANIYGSYYEVSKIKNETRTQFLLDAEHYYKLRYSNTISLY